jgi:hypothetical protein
MRRREAMALLGAVAAWPLSAGAQQPERMRRIGVLIPYSENDAQAQAEVAAFRGELQQLGWIEGRNVAFEGRWAAGDVARISALAKELVKLQDAARSLDLETAAMPARDAGELERAIEAFARDRRGALVVQPDVTTTNLRKVIIALAARHRLPAVYPFRFVVREGGLAAYGIDVSDVYRRAAGYVDRILRGERPGELPVQAATQFELAINLATAKELGLSVSPALLARADEVIE